jgi:glycosyltransferase involved in cell wall biosynthesis
MTLFTNKVINVSKGEQAQCIEKKVLHKNLSQHIYNGIKPLEKKINTILENTYKNKFVIVTLSRFDFQKNMILMYRIASELKGRKEIQFIFIGDGYDKRILEEKSKQEGLTNIDFVGFKNHKEIAEYFSVSDLYLSTARWEGLPFALVEAAFFGLPIVASDVIGNNEVCIDGKNGYTFPTEDVDKAVELILKIYERKDKLLEFSKNSKLVFQENFTVQKMVYNHELLYNHFI